MNCVPFTSTKMFIIFPQKIEDYCKEASDLVSKMNDLHQRLINLDGFRMSESDDDLELYWGMSSELISIARHVLQSGEILRFTLIVFYKSLYKFNYLLPLFR